MTPTVRAIMLAVLDRDFGTIVHTPPEEMWRDPNLVVHYQGEYIFICNSCYKRLKVLLAVKRDMERR